MVHGDPAEEHAGQEGVRGELPLAGLQRDCQEELQQVQAVLAEDAHVELLGLDQRGARDLLQLRLLLRDEAVHLRQVLQDAPVQARPHHLCKPKQLGQEVWGLLWRRQAIQCGGRQQGVLPRHPVRVPYRGHQQQAQPGRGEKNNKKTSTTKHLSDFFFARRSSRTKCSSTSVGRRVVSPACR